MKFHPSRIVYQDEHLLAIDKLSGELVVKGAGKVQKLPLLDFLKQDFPGLQTVHRLDFETSGVVVFAKTKQAAEVAKSQIKDWKKTYITLVAGRLKKPKGTIAKKLPARNNQQMVAATSHYQVLELYANSSYIEVDIETGRHHQIRRHFAAIHHPLVLDHIYGHKKYNNVFSQELKFRKFFLHAKQITLTHPVTGNKLTIEAPLPKPFSAVLKKLRSLS